MSSDPNDQPNPPDNHLDSDPPAEPAPSEAGEPAQSPADPATESSQPRRRILIGSQRDPSSYRPQPKRDWEPIAGKGKRKPPKAREKAKPAEGSQPLLEQRTVEQPPTGEQLPPAPGEVRAAAGIEPPPSDRPPGAKRFPPPNLREQLSADLEKEFQQAVADIPVEDLMSAGDAMSSQTTLEPDSRHAARVMAVRRDDVFVELGSREQGILSLRLFPEPPAIGATVEVAVVRFNADDGLYELSLPGTASSISDWGDLAEGMLVEARITGHNAGGLECEVNHIRGFMPISQVSLYRVENLEEFVEQRLTCLVTEADPERRNLVVSRRAVLEREKEEARKTMLASLKPGEIRDGVVRKLVEFGAFVELGSGVDGLLHVSQMGWGRIKHPSEVLHEGQTIRVRIEKVDPEARRISLAYRDMLENPWTNVEGKYPVNAPVHGRVTKLMEFGAFVELEPGVEGLVHISELSHKRVMRVSDVLKEGAEIDVMVLSVDPAAQRISLSLKDMLPEPELPAAPAPSASSSAPAAKPRKQPTRPLQGGLGRVPGASRFGRKW